MNATLLIAAREYRQLTSTRSFWLTLLLIPATIVMVAVLPNLYRIQEERGAFVVYDASGCCNAEIDHELELSYQGDVIGHLRDYAKRLHVKPPASAPWLATDGRSLDDTDAEAFIAAGGLAASLAALKPLLPADAPAFVAPPRHYYRVELPASVGKAIGPEAFGDVVRSYLSQPIATPDGPAPLVLAAYIPAKIASRDEPIRFFTTGAQVGAPVSVISGVVLHTARAELMTESGLAPARGAEIERFVPVQYVIAPQIGSAQRLVVRSILPLCIAYLLMLTVIVSGTMMLQGVIEERSNKLIEMILACVTAQQLMRGKLIGVAAVGLTIVGTWVAFSAAAAHFLPPQLAAFLAPAMETLHSPLVVVCLLFYFLTGYLMTSMLFLTIGALSDSMQDAQGYLMPLMLLLCGPFIAIGGSVVGDPDGFLPKLLSWIPIYTPFAMLARLGGGVPRQELIGTAALLLLFIVAEFIVLGRVFRASLLRAGRRPHLLAALTRARG